LIAAGTNADININIILHAVLRFNAHKEFLTMDGIFLLDPDASAASRMSNVNSADAEAQLALTESLRATAYQIRHEGYHSYEYITERPDGLFSDKYDGRRNVRTAIIYRNGIAAATVRLCLFDPTGGMPDSDSVPAMEIFGDEITGLVDALSKNNPACRAVEVTRMARRPEFANDKGLIHALFRVVGYLILYFDADIVINACRPHHVPMYRRFGFQKLEEPRQYPNLTYQAALMACFRANYGAATANLPFLRGISMDDAAYASLIAGERTKVFQTVDVTHKAPLSQRPASKTAHGYGVHHNIHVSHSHLDDRHTLAA
jgi:hypothetical protein